MMTAMKNRTSLNFVEYWIVNEKFSTQNDPDAYGYSFPKYCRYHSSKSNRSVISKNHFTFSFSNSFILLTLRENCSPKRIQIPFYSPTNHPPPFPPISETLPNRTPDPQTITWQINLPIQYPRPALLLFQILPSLIFCAYKAARI